MVKWLGIGIGDIARKRVLPAILREPRSELYGLLTRDPAKAQAYAGARVFTTLDAALRDPAVDRGLRGVSRGAARSADHRRPARRQTRARARSRRR
jgi:hypothetical protein